MSGVRVHNEWFMPVSLRHRKSCPTCRQKLPQGESIYAWGEYQRARWYTVMYFCVQCFASEVIPRLTDHAKGCGCTFQLNARSGYTLPHWLTLDKEHTCV